jgi:hypothetical protein
MFKQSGKGYVNANIHIYQNTLIMLATSHYGLNLTAQDPTGSKIANNLAIMINGNVNVAYRLAAGTLVDGNLYWKMNAIDPAYLVGSYDTVPALFSAFGIEPHGLGSLSGRGTDPVFEKLSLSFIDKTRPVWQLQPDSEILQPSDFFLAPESPARAAGIDLTPYNLPDSRPANTSPDLGAYPFGTQPSEYNVFPYFCTQPAC